MDVKTTILVALILITDVQSESPKRLLVDDNYHAIIQRLDTVEQEISSLKAENTALRQNHVAFHAELTTTVTGAHHHIYFDKVKVNIGNAYNSHHGMFVTPINGTYLFSVNACSLDPHYVTLDFTINNSVYGRLIAGDANFATCSSKSFIVQLKSGDDVYVKHETHGDYLSALEPYGLPSFSGALLYGD